MGVRRMELEDRINLERRISKAEENLVALHDDIKDIKKGLYWLTGLIFTMNSTIIGILAKALNII